MASSSVPSQEKKINHLAFYQQWAGHPIEDLRIFRNITYQKRSETPVIYLAGDSSLDNKFWVPSPGPGGEPLPVTVPDIYNHTFGRPQPKPDVAFWVNHVFGEEATCINAAVEESMLRQRDHKLLQHDEFVRDSIRSQDILIVSIGANDIAMKPTLRTAWHMLCLAWLTPRSWIENGKAPSLSYFRNLFGTKIKDYITRLTAEEKPSAVIVCMIYYPLEARRGQSGWADWALGALGYSWWPAQLQAAIKQIYHSATDKIQVEGTRVAPCALFGVMDGTKKQDYVDRVEPSVEGGRKIAAKFREMLLRSV